MESKTSTHISVDCSNGLKALLLNPKTTIAVAAAYPQIEQIFFQVQRDLAIKNDDELTLQVTKGLGHIDNILKLFQAEGGLDLKAESK